MSSYFKVSEYPLTKTGALLLFADAVRVVGSQTFTLELCLEDLVQRDVPERGKIALVLYEGDNETWVSAVWRDPDTNVTRRVNDSDVLDAREVTILRAYAVLEEQRRELNEE